MFVHSGVRFYKIYTSWLTNLIYRYIFDHNNLVEEQNGFKRSHQWCKKQLIIVTPILKQAQTEQGNIFTAFVE